jgi:hypothetical protein
MQLFHVVLPVISAIESSRDILLLLSNGILVRHSLFVTRSSPLQSKPDQRAAVLVQSCWRASPPKCAVVSLVTPSSSKTAAANASRRGQGLRQV